MGSASQSLIRPPHHVFIISFFFSPLLNYKAAAPYPAVFDTTCQNKPHCLISALDMFFFKLFLPSTEDFLCQIPP